MQSFLSSLVNGDAAAQSTIIERLERMGFRDANAAAKRLRGFFDGADPQDIVVACLHKMVGLLSEVADPDAGLIEFEGFVRRTSDRGQLFQFLDDNPRAIDILVRLFAHSRYLTETVSRDPQTLRELIRHRRLADLKSREDFLEGALSVVGAAPDHAARLDALRRFQRWELLRIGLCDAFGLIDLRAATVQLSLLADSLVQACLTLVGHELMLHTTNVTVLALGKLGGEELNYSSDIDLVFLTDRHPNEAVPIAQRLVKALQDTTGEGFLYRVDVRLRPWGRSGELVTTIPSYMEYLRSHAALWEKQALLKARVIAGSRELGRELLRHAEPLIFGASAEDVRVSIQQAKQRIEADLQRRGREWGEVKLGTGSIRDVEFVVQALQLVHGGEHRHIRSPNTLDALVRLTDAGILHADEYRRLTDGYVFLRTIEHSLQLMNNRQEHALPTEPRELTLLARRLDFASSEQLLAHFDSHRESIRSIFEKFLLRPRGLTEPVIASALPQEAAVHPTGFESYETVFTEADRSEHAHLLTQVTNDRPVKVMTRQCLEKNEATNQWWVTVLGHDCPGELSMICGLLFAYGFDIAEGFVWTEIRPRAEGGRDHSPNNFVDVFKVRSNVEVFPAAWQRYEDDLNELVLMARSGRADDAQGLLVKRVADAIDGTPDLASRPAPLEVRFDNERHPRATVLTIRGDDTMGFLYELANALTLSGVSIEQVAVRAEVNRVLDTLLVTDAVSGGKIVDAARLQELQAAVVLIKHFTHLIPAAPNPKAALLHFRTFLRDLFQRLDWVEQLSSLERPEVLSALAQLLGVSDFLWEDFLRLQYANLFPVLCDIADLRQFKGRKEFELEWNEILAKCSTAEERRVRLNEFKDRELFRIDMRHILGHSGGIEGFGNEMTCLAEVVVAAAVSFCESELQTRFGVPTQPDGTDCSLAVCALGKCGGQELGFASDIELLFVYSDEGETRSNKTNAKCETTTNSNFYSRLVESVSHAIHARAEGDFRIDLRLRPYGRAGSLAVSLDAFRSYFQIDGPAWPYERQSLVKLRSIAGDKLLGRKVEALRDEILYSGTPVNYAAVAAMRERQQHQLVGSTDFNAKLSPGGLVDLEYLVQSLQINHGAIHPRLRTTSTREALEALQSVGVLTKDEYLVLTEAYQFLKRVIDSLRMVRGDARDLAVPTLGTADFESLARRLGYGPKFRQLQDDVLRHAQSVMSLVRTHFLKQDSDS